MHRTIREDWAFDIRVLDAGPCRIGLEPGDRFSCTYGCPEGSCPKTMGLPHTLCEAARAGGDYRRLGGCAEREMDFICAHGVMTFRLRARRLDG